MVVGNLSAAADDQGGEGEEVSVECPKGRHRFCASSLILTKQGG